MVTKKQRESQLRFVFRYSYGIPEDLMDHIDFEAYADPEITFSDNVQSIAESYPSVKSYLPVDWQSKSEEVLQKGEKLICGIFSVELSRSARSPRDH